MRTRRTLASIAGAFTLAAAALLPAQQEQAPGDIGWPRELQTDSAKIVVYQPQPDSVAGNRLFGRSAIAIIPNGKTTPSFGVVWMTGRVMADRDTRLVAIDQITVTNVRFPGSTPQREQTFRDLVNPQIEHWRFEMSMDRYSASLAEAAAVQRSADSLNTTPPAILFSKSPAVLLLYQGEPIVRKFKDTPFQIVVNTPAFVVRDSASPTFYLNGGPLWYSAASPLGPWSHVTQVPAAISRLVPDSIQKDSAPPGPPPQIIVATKPTELIVTDGDPTWSPITGTDLLYVPNTEGAIFRELNDQRIYVLLAGRWFAAPSFDGPWGFVRPDSLPKSFAKIPAAFTKSDVLASVPGTQQATDALLDAQVPQTAAIDRATAKVTVTYDGDPKFAPVPGTQIQYATNTASQVLKIDTRYYVCDKGVWFTSVGPMGPWAVSDSVPKAVQSIPPESPVYNVKYVEVYQSTPQVVYVGYTPGYMWTYPYYGTVVYGTGYYYPPYVGPVVYYPPPVTYGVAIRYNPWTGFTVGFGYATPFFYVGFAMRPPYYGGYWGPYGRPPYPPPYYRPPYGGYPGYRPPPPGYRPPPPGYRPPGGATATPYHGNNIYRQPGASDRLAPASAVTRDVKSGGVGGTRPNNVVAGKDGNQWQKQSGGQWQNAGNATHPSTQPSTRPSTQPSAQPSTRPSTQPAKSGVPNDVNRTMQTRQQGQQRTQNYNHARSSGGATRSAPRGGGGGRRP